MWFSLLQRRCPVVNAVNAENAVNTCGEVLHSWVSLFLGEFLQLQCVFILCQGWVPGNLVPNARYVSDDLQKCLSLFGVPHFVYRRASGIQVGIPSSHFNSGPEFNPALQVFG